MTFCVYCGTALTDPSRCGQCGAYKVDSRWHQAAARTLDAGTDDSGWRPDPTGRHEGRYFVAGQPTDLIRDGGAEAIDPVGKQQLDQAAAETYSQPTATIARPARGRLWWSIAAVVLVLALAGTGVGVTLYVNRDRETVDDRFLADLKQSGLSGEFNSDANAVAQGKQICRELEGGAPQQGMAADQIAVSHYCPQFSEGFHVLETLTVTGSIALKVDSPSYYSPAITVQGSECSGNGGYSDIDAGTQVTVKNGKGEILTTTMLEPGEGGVFLCTFRFSFDVTEGEDRYVIAVSRRGEMSFSFAELKSTGVALVLGD